MAQPTIMNRVQSMGQKASNQLAPNPNFPAFFSGQNLKNFAGDLWSGAGTGLQGGAVGGIAGGAANAFMAARNAATPIQNMVTQVAQPTGQAPAMSPGLTAPNSQINTPAEVPGLLKSTYAGLMGAADKIIPQAKQVASLLQDFAPTQAQQGQGQKYLPQSPTAQSGPSIISQGAVGEGGKPYYSFEKFFGTGQVGLRPLVSETNDKAAGMPQEGREDNRQQVAQQPGQQPPQPAKPEMEQWGRPNPEGKGLGAKLKGYAYDTFNWLHDNPWAERIAGFAAGAGATVASGGTLGAASPLIGAAAGAGFKGLMGQLKNFLAERTDMPQQQQAASQQMPNILNQKQPTLGMA